MNKLWLPKGHHWDLHIEHRPLLDAGNFTGGGHKVVLHTTESPWDTVDSMYRVLRDKRAAPHFVIGGREGLQHPVVIQMVPLNRAGRALANDPYDGFETNRANAIQIEICWYAADAQNMPREYYHALANLIELIDHRFDIPFRSQEDFSHAERMTDAEFVAAEGLVGHSMVPDNDHTDPGRFHEGWLLSDLKNMPSGGWDL